MFTQLPGTEGQTAYKFGYYELFVTIFPLLLSLPYAPFKNSPLKHTKIIKEMPPHLNSLFLDSAVCCYEALLPFLVTENLLRYLHLVKTKHSSMTAAYFLLAAVLYFSTKTTHVLIQAQCEH